MVRTETLALEDALGRVLASPLISPIDVPAFRNSAMDGYALASPDLSGEPPYVLPVEGTSLAGHPMTEALSSGTAVRIFTGAALPDGADSIVVQEDTVRLDEGRVQINVRPSPARFVRPVGHDVAAEHELAARGATLDAFLIAAATTSGIERVNVFERPRVGVFATGDELREPGARLGPGEIYESNRRAIRMLLQGCPLDVVDLGILPDDEAATKAALASAGSEFDALVTSGGVSVGDADYVRQAIEARGSIDFWRLNLRPGKPFAFGRVGSSCYIFGLPGNPVSSIVTMLLLTRPALIALAGGNARLPSAFSAPLAESAQHEAGRDEYQRGRFVVQDGELRVTTYGDQSSNRLSSISGADCLFLLPGTQTHFEPGERVDVLPFRGLL